MNNKLIIRNLGLQTYESVLVAMHNFTNKRTKYSIDEIWLVQHLPVFTQGRYNNKNDILIPNNIPLIISDRGGKITFHAPGQQIIYFLLNLYNRKITIHNFIHILEKTVISTLSKFNIKAHTISNMPGVYVNGDKICSLGLRVRKGCTMHGIALNISMNMTPFTYINPCGYAGLRMTQIANFIPKINIKNIIKILSMEFIKLL